MRHLLFFCAMTLSTSAFAALSHDIKTFSPSDLPWVETPEGVAFADLNGDRFSGPYQAMVKLPAGLVSPPHIKTANMFGVMISGEMRHWRQDQKPADVMPIGPGGFYQIPAEIPHQSACISDIPCVAYLYQDGAFDFNVVAQ
ncbi:MAG: DUF4437 domain-containing protein [Cognatishimia sp.]|uniref:cupin domain-containing protein n=1 Tax=Cognatishimia sp. TaxID=2211648 RepID=UPI003B8AB568